MAEQNNTQDLAKEDKERYTEFKKRIDVCKQYRRKLISNWTANIDYRRGKPFASQTDEDRIVVNLDWSLTKAKQAALFSQVPRVHVNHPPQTTEAGPWLSQFEQRINDTLITAGIEAAMDEVMADVINAAGMGVLIVSHQAITEDREVPVQDLSMYDPAMQEQITASKMLPDGTPLEMQTVPFVVDRKYTINRISPSDFLWPISFVGSDFDNAPWKGFSGTCSWADGKRQFKLKDEDKEKVLAGAGTKNLQDKLTHDVEKDKIGADEEISYDQIFYREYQYSADAKSFNKIKRLVFVSGIDDPVIDEDWAGQRIDQESGTIVGSLKDPVRVLTLTYISDETIPPSDTAIGRPQVNEINKSRTQMMQQRERSGPVRWFNSDRVPPQIHQALMRGVWQGMIPVQGDGTKIIGDVGRAPMPPENFTFDQVAKGDLQESWQIGPNQQGSFGQGRQSASEANLVESNFQTRIGRERAKVAKFFVSIAEVLGGLMCIFEEPSSFPEGFDPAISKTLAYSILADSTVLLDSNQRLKRLLDFFNFTAKTGWVDMEPVLKEIATLSGLDPNVVIRPPQPAPPAEPNISLRMTGTEDMMNPLMLAILMKSGQGPPPELIEQAKKLIEMSVMPPNQQGMVPGQPPVPPAPPEPAPPPVGAANPEAGLMPKINQRSDQEL
jgi:hypothetical protein